MSDADLAERLEQRDDHAFLSLYDLHHPSVYRFLLHMTGSVSIAEELTQEVFVVILDAMCAGTIGQFDARKGTLEGYLLGIARNLARAERRRIKRVVGIDTVLDTPEWQRVLESAYQTAYQGAEAWDVATLLAVRSEMKILYRGIQDLPEHYREVLVLCGLQEKSYREAAGILQCSEGTIGSRMNRAKSLLAAKLRRGLTGSAKRGSTASGKEGADVASPIAANGK